MVAAIPPIGGAGALGAAAGANRPDATPAPGFGDALQRGVQQVSDLEKSADLVTNNLASGGGAEVHDLMIASTKSQVAMDTLVQVRNRAVEAYSEIMRLQV